MLHSPYLLRIHGCSRVSLRKKEIWTWLWFTFSFRCRIEHRFSFNFRPRIGSRFRFHFGFRIWLDACFGLRSFLRVSWDERTVLWSIPISGSMLSMNISFYLDWNTSLYLRSLLDIPDLNKQNEENIRPPPYFYLRAIASPVNSAQFPTIPRNSRTVGNPNQSSWIPGPICLKIELVNSAEPRKCSYLVLIILILNSNLSFGIQEQYFLSFFKICEHFLVMKDRPRRGLKILREKTFNSWRNCRRKFKWPLMQRLFNCGFFINFY